MLTRCTAVGFGGANAHAVLESYHAPRSDNLKALEPRTVAFSPFTFSAASMSSMLSMLGSYSNHLKISPEMNLYDLAWTLQQRKSVLIVRMSFSAQTRERLISKLDEVVSKMEHNDTSIHNIRSAPQKPHILGIFTGQGAQWAGMGGCLIRSSSFVRRRLEDFDQSLAELPPPDRPEWRLQE